MARPTYASGFMKRFGIDTNDAIWNLQRYGDFLLKQATRPKAKSIKSILFKEAELLGLIASQFHKPKLKTGRARANLLANVVTYMSNQYRVKVKSNFLDKMECHTGNYLESTQFKSNIRFDRGVVYSYVGDIRHMMHSTDLLVAAERKSPYGSNADWLNKKYMAFGRHITGYWYFQEFGFYHWLTGNYIQNQIFLDSDAEEVLRNGEIEFDRRLSLLFKAFWKVAFD